MKSFYALCVITKRYIKVRSKCTSSQFMKDIRFHAHSVTSNHQKKVISKLIYRVSSKTVYTVILLFSRVPYHIQKNFWPFFNSPGDEDFKTHLTLLPRWKIDQVTAQNVRQTGFWKYHFDGRFCFFIEGVANFRVNYLSHF